MWNWFCRTKNSRKGGGLSFFGLSPQGTTSLDASYAEAEKRSDCGKSVKENTSFLKFYSELKTANTDIVNAWSNCMANSYGLVASMSTSPNPEKFAIRVSYRPNPLSGKPLKVHLSYDEGEGKCTALKSPLIGGTFVHCELAKNSTGMQVGIEGEGIADPPEFAFGKISTPTGPPPLEQKHFYIFGGGEPSAGISKMSKSRVTVFDGTGRSAFGTLERDTLLLPYVGWTLGSGVMLPNNAGIYWPTQRIIWSGKKFTENEVREALVGDWEIHGKSTLIFLDQNRLMVRGENPMVKAVELKLISPLDGRVPAWNSLRATIMPDLKTIVWWNSRVWTKKEP